MPGTSFNNDTLDGIVTADGFQNLNASFSVNAAGGITTSGVTNTGISTSTAANTVTAFAGGGQASATQLTTSNNRVPTVATAADSVKLPLAVAGQTIHLVNGHATNSMQVFGGGTDTINDVATGTGVAQAAGKAATYFCTKSAPAGLWYRVLSA